MNKMISIFLFMNIFFIIGVGAFFAPVYGGTNNRSGIFVGVSVAFATPLNYVSPPLAFDCTYDPEPTLGRDVTFLCEIGNATEKNIICHGITRNPVDDSVLAIYPSENAVANYGITQGYAATPGKQTTQYVKVLIGNNRVKANTTTTYEAFCASDDVPALTASYAVNLTPAFEEPTLIVEVQKSITNNAGYIVGGIFVVIFIGIIILLVWRNSQ